MAKQDSISGSVIEPVPSKEIIPRTKEQIPPPEDPNAPSADVSSKRQRLSDLFTIFCAGFALISDGYQNSLMTMTNVILAAEYTQYTSTYATQISNALLVGDIFGQISIGLTCDYMGRKAAIVITTSLIVVGGILATASNGVTIPGFLWCLTIARFVVGLGVGGEYPASSTSAVEAANSSSYQKQRGPIFVLVTNLPLTLGAPLALSIFLVVLSAAGSNHLSTVWRVCFGIGVIFPLSVFYFRMKMLNSTLYRRSAMKRHVPYRLILRYYWKTLIGTCSAWFLYDFVTFPNGIFSGTIISEITGGKSIKETAEWTLLLTSLQLPGVFIGAWLINRIGRKRTMMAGFLGYLVFGLIVGCAFDQLQGILPLFVVFYGLMLSSGSGGPGNNLGLLSSECYATGIRGTAYSLSAAWGKTGAAVGTQAFEPVATNLGQRWTFIIASIVGLLGVLVTWFFIPDLKGDDLAKDDERFRLYLVEHGWTGEMGEKDLKAFANEGIPDSIFDTEKTS